MPFSHCTPPARISSLPVASHHNPHDPVRYRHLSRCQGMGCGGYIGGHENGIMISDRGGDTRHYLCSAACLFTFAAREVEGQFSSTAPLPKSPTVVCGVQFCTNQVDTNERTHPMVRSCGVERHYCSDFCEQVDGYQWLRDNTRQYHQRATTLLVGEINSHFDRAFPHAFRVAVEMGQFDHHELMKSHLLQTYKALVSGVQNALTTAFSSHVKRNDDNKRRAKNNKKRKITGGGTNVVVEVV